MSSDSNLFRTGRQLEARGYAADGNVYRKPGADDYVPLYEAKMVHHFDHRWATYEGDRTRGLTIAEKEDPEGVVHGRYWVRYRDVQDVLDKTGWERGWLMGWRDIARSTDIRTVVGGVFPLSAVGNKLPVWMAAAGSPEVLISLLSSFACDFAARFKVGGTNLNFFIAEQLPVPAPATVDQKTPWSPSNPTIGDWLRPRVLELTYTAWDLQPFAHDCGYHGPPFRWDDERRFLLRCELDAACFHLYLPAGQHGGWLPARRSDGCPYDETSEQFSALNAHFPTPRDAIAYIMDTFPIVCRKDEERYGDYRTKRVILEIYDAMQKAIATGEAYDTVLDPPPADPVCCYRHRECND